MRFVILRTVALVGLMTTAHAAPPNCGVIAAADLAEALGGPPRPEQVRLLAEAHAGPDVSMEEVRDMAGSLGAQVAGYRASVDELGERGEPAIAHLSAPEHFACVVGIDAQWVQMLDGWPSRLEVMARAEFEARYTGA